MDSINRIEFLSISAVPSTEHMGQSDYTITCLYTDPKGSRRGTFVKNGRADSRTLGSLVRLLATLPTRS